MEYFPSTPFEAPVDPDQSGDKKLSKKKKKTTRIPLPVQKLEANDDYVVLEHKPKTPSGFEAFFIKQEDDNFKDTGEVSNNAREGMLLEGELTREGGVIINHPEATKSQDIGNILLDIHNDAELPQGPDEESKIVEAYEVPSQQAATRTVEAPIEVKTPESITPTEITYNNEEIVPTPIDYESVVSEPLSTPERQSMIDPSVSKDIDISAEQYHTETVKPQITERDLSDAYYRGQKRGVSRGVASGALFGWWLGKRGKRAVERESKMALDNRDKEIKSLKSEHIQAAERLEAIRRTQGHLEAATSKKMEHGIDTERPVVLRGNTYQKTPVIFEQNILSHNKPEATTVMAEKQAEVIKPVPELKPIIEERYTPVLGRRVETSSWHRYEVDAATGKLVENPTIAYGEEFNKERKQELLRKKLTDEAVVSSVGSALLTGADSVGVAQSKPLTKPQNNKPHRSPLLSVLTDTKFIKQQLVRRTTDPATWVVAVVFVVLLFLAGVLR